ncbi:YjcZ family sporulation protein [Bacillus sp. EB600]
MVVLFILLIIVGPAYWN